MENEQTRTIEVKIPPGVAQGSVIRLKGQGEAGVGNESSGDLLLKIKIIPDKRFQVDGHDLHAETPVSPWEAALGTKLKIQTLEGDVWLKVPPGSQSGRRFRLKGKGLLQKKGRGDLYVKLKIAIPESLNEEHRMLIVGSEIDSSSQRIINYLAETHRVPINAATFNARAPLFKPRRVHVMFFHE